jgi:hypothetical protein
MAKKKASLQSIDFEKVFKQIPSPSTGKEADFASWAILKASLGGDNPMTESEFAQKLTKCGVTYSDPESIVRVTGDLTVGEYVKIDKNNCDHPQNQEVCNELHLQVAIITKIVSNGTDCVISVKRVNVQGEPVGHELSFNGYNGKAPSGKKVGLYRFKFVKPSESEEGEFSSKQFEVIYFKDKSARPSPQYRIEQSTNFVQQAVKNIDSVLTNSEKYLVNYYQGSINYFTKNKQGEMYCSLKANKTRSFGESIGDFVSLNPSKGTLFYIGLVGHRPDGWMGELLSLMYKDNTGN